MKAPERRAPLPPYAAGQTSANMPNIEPFSSFFCKNTLAKRS
jgi:hypothetical protein